MEKGEKEEDLSEIDEIIEKLLSVKGYVVINIHPNLNIFFCHPNASFEKGACERNHVLVRYIQYKGWSFDNLNQSDINTLFSHINSYPRKSLNNRYS